jgi:hypothetical protein
MKQKLGSAILFALSMTSSTTPTAYARLDCPSSHTLGYTSSSGSPESPIRQNLEQSSRLSATDDGRTLLKVPKHTFDLLQSTAEVFSDLSRQHVRVR